MQIKVKSPGKDGVILDVGPNQTPSQVARKYLASKGLHFASESSVKPSDKPPEFVAGFIFAIEDYKGGPLEYAHLYYEVR